jgi:uroporphyrin-III C-methyltransferase
MRTEMEANPNSLFAALNCVGQIHLVIGTNTVAAHRCRHSIQAGASPLLIAEETAELHYALQTQIDAGEVKWLKKSFEDTDLFTLGREEVGSVVDAVFITSGMWAQSMQNPKFQGSKGPADSQGK